MSSRSRRIVALRKRGTGYQRIADKVGVTQGYVYKVLRANGLVKSKKRRKAKSSRRSR